VIVHVFETADAAAHAVAEQIAEAVRRKPALVLGLPAGQTPVPVYAELRSASATGASDFSRISTFNLDEFAGLDAAHPGSFRRFMDAHLFRGIAVHPSRMHFLDGTAPDLEAECRRYDAAIAGAGGIDVLLLGIGRNGHIGFNEPAEALIAGTHVVTLLPDTRQANASLFGGNAEQVPVRALTMGVGTILGAREILLIATGDKKAAALEAALTGSVTPRVPASFLQLHAAVAVFADRPAAARLR
jgi:glucosamine-6-phosphate deaminase